VSGRRPQACDVEESPEEAVAPLSASEMGSAGAQLPPIPKGDVLRCPLNEDRARKDASWS